MPLCFALACLAGPTVASDGAAKPDVVAFNATVRVDVDASGKPVKVEAPADLPESIRAFIEKRVASWQYAPARQNGVPVSAVTFVMVGACAMPAAEGYRLGLDFKGNGPAVVDPGPWFMRPPQYPGEAQRGGAEGSFQVSYSIRPDGTTTLGSIVPIETNTGSRHARVFKQAIASWIEAQRFQPEQVNGVAVATEVSFPVDFELRDGGNRQAYGNELKARALASKECIAASAPSGLLPMATNSPVKVTPVPAG
ncbi:MAG: energy transducer TonB [Thermomonas sp.]